MSRVREALREVKNEEIAGLGTGLPSEASRIRAERTLTLIAAGKVLDHLGAKQVKVVSRGELDEEGRRLAVSVPRHRVAEAHIPAGFEGADTPERTIHLVETETKIYRSYPYGLHGIFPLATTQRVAMSEESGAESGKVVVTGSNNIGFYESANSLEELVAFSRDLELVARAEGFYGELAARNQDLFLPEGYAEMRAH